MTDGPRVALTFDAEHPATNAETIYFARASNVGQT